MDTLKTSFGKKKVNQNEKTFLVQNIFSNVAKNYDLMNDIMSLGAHRLWKKELIDFMNIQPDDRIVDIGSGTGDLINLISKRYSFKEIYSVDLNQEMLNIGKKRFNKENIKFIKANAELLPFEDNTFDKYIISFCIRNVTDVRKALKEAIRVLKPGGIFYCLEFSQPNSGLINLVYKKYKKNIIPWIGKKISKNKEAYRYLEESIDIFPNQNDFLFNIKKIGFNEASYMNFFNGIVAVHRGFKI